MSGTRNQRFYIKPEISGVYLKNLSLNVDQFFSNINTTGTVIGSNLIYNTGNNNISGTLVANNLVYNTGNQVISGDKTFINNINVSGTGTFLGVNLDTINSLTLSGVNINITGNSVLNVFNEIRISGNPVLTGVDLSSYATITNLASTGSTLNSKINALSGVAVLTYGNQNITGVKTFNNKVLLNTSVGAGYDPSNNDLRLNIGGSTNVGDGVLIDSYGAGGSSNVIGRKARGSATNLSGLQKDDLIFLLQARGYSPGSGYVSSSRAAWRIYAEEDWTGTTNHGTYMTFRTTNSGTSSSLDKLIINSSGVSILNGNLYLNGNPVLTGVDLSSYATITNLASTGSTLDSKINALSGVAVLTYGDQNITGNKTFINNLYVQGTGVFNSLDFSSITDIVLSGATINLINSIVNSSGQIYISGNPVLTGIDLSPYATKSSLDALSGVVVLEFGDQAITGNKTFIDSIAVNKSISGRSLTLTNSSIVSGQGDTKYLTWYGAANTTGIFELFIDNTASQRLILPNDSVGNLNLSVVAGYIPSTRMSTFNTYYHFRRATTTITILSSGLLNSGSSATNPLDINFGVGGIFLSGNNTNGELSIFTRPNGITASAGNTRVKCVGQFNLLSTN